LCNNVLCCNREKNLIFNWVFTYKKTYFFFNFQLTLKKVNLVTISLRIIEKWWCVLFTGSYALFCALL